MYHRVLPSDHEEIELVEPGMYVTPETLDMHLKLLRGIGEIVHLDDYQFAKRNNRSYPKRAIAITFDDGWFDNYKYAFPVLKRNNAKASIFLVTHMMDTKKMFWPERLTTILKSDELNESFSLIAPDEKSWLESIGYKKNIVNDHLSQNHISQLISSAKSYSEADIIAILDRITAAIGLKDTHSKRTVLTWDEFLEMRDSGLVSAGSHTCNHIRLTDKLDEVQETREIRDSKLEIEEKIGDKVVSFCYPNGDTCRRAREKVEKLYSLSVSTSKGINRPKDGFHMLRRISLHDDMSNTPYKFLSKLSCLI